MTVPDFQDVLGRVQIIHGTPPAQPGKCVMCGTTDGTFIDIGFDIDFYGTVYFCFGSCFREIANRLEYFSPDQVKHIREQFNELVEHNHNMYQENMELRDALDSVLRVTRFATDSEPRDFVLDEGESEPVATTPESTNADESDDSGSEQGLVKSSDESGSTVLRDDDGTKELFDELGI